ncbi:TonB-dependent receptor [Novosphingobium cyanobacteriorum]|uniref:TonB-dependent receptor n=1 Tax=Novosphingobium cyanobacteriorum TaxID=3024215 RepID=A0ABT6CKZ1_9SPHN|nr:TonB-dependent receptor [Novosphingobium cyanobacteriorum]MDF8334571.1 TonB-dependent receptor [Novosphingobium cyanobacteriorum]
MLRLSLIAGVSMSALLATSGARAQEASAGTIGEIIVTARKTAESQQTVPIAITTLGGDALQQKTIQSVRDIQFNVPGLVNYPEPQGGAPGFAIRGTRQQGITGSQGGVAVYLGYVPLTSTMSIKNSNYDMQSVQVLKGPQGTLFGKNTTGGAIIFMPNAPSDKFEGMTKVGYSRWDRKDLTAMINVPISEFAALRIAGRYIKSDGRLKNVIDPNDPDVAFYDSVFGAANRSTKDLWAEDNQSLRVSLKLTPTENLTNTTMFDWYHQTKDQTDNQAGLITKINGTCGALYGTWDFSNFPNIAPAANDSGCISDFARQQRQGNQTTTRLWPVYVSGTWWGITNTTELEIGDVTVRNIFSYRKDNIENSEDDSGVDAPILKGWNKVPAHAYTNEINIFGKAFDNRLDYTIGALWSNQTTRQMLNYSVLNYWRDRDPFGVLPAWNLLNPRWADYTYGNKTLAGFGQINYHVDDKFTFLLGGRYTSNKQTYLANEYTGIAAGVNPASLIGKLAIQGLPTALSNMTCVTGAFATAGEVFDAANCRLRRKANFNSFIFNAGFQYQADPRTMFYVNVGKGYQSGGFNNQQPVAYATFKPETVMNFEAGLKKDWLLFGRPIRTNAAMFYAKYKDQQRSLNGSFNAADIARFNLPPSLLGSSFIAVFNASNSTTWGGELELAYNLTDHFQLSAFYTYINARYDSFDSPPYGNASGLTNLSGRALSSTPAHTANVSMNYTIPVNSNDGGLRFTLNAYYRSKVLTNDRDASVDTTIPGYAIVNARIDLIKTLPLDIGIWANNLLDKEYAIFKNSTLDDFGLARTDFGEPRAYGVEVTYRF